MGLGFQLLLYTDVCAVQDAFFWCAAQQKILGVSCGLRGKIIKFGTFAFRVLLGEVP